ncbi:MAG: Polysaccharide biosynthesis/export protein [Cypionkella sp.]|uniref:polysaccharide biosynthesis/export family protein n=1 Tax=Cypionkella sp. TaxID=2811411 RepID=UPI00260C7740|nr:polysaccharide biosynthesis/export family protein [Cypionkella sp.]MDB5661606.1 Polysaccharide biosynthesis/export protein [Cypionkella sp.]
MFVKLVSMGLVLVLAGCGSLPRSAGLQREVLKQGSKIDPAVAQADQVVPTEFAVEAITKDSLARYASWPEAGPAHLGWIKRVAQPSTRIIAPGDTVALSVWVTEDNSLLTTPGQRFVSFPSMQVSSTGQIFLPYIGTQKISGMSPEHARSTIEKAYSAVTPSAQVQLGLTEGRESSVSVVSGVGNPGPYPLSDQDVTLLDILAASGGPNQRFKNPQVRLQRGSRTYGIGMDRLSEDSALNTTLQGGDRILVAEDDRYFLSLGAAGSRAQHQFPQDKVSALDALSIIGGLAAERANAQGILVLRSYPQSAVRRDGTGPRHVRTIFTLDLTSADGLFSAGAFAINPGDLIYVTESPLVGTRNVFSLVGSVFGLATQAERISSD